MKLTTLFLVVVILQVSASSFAQKITLNERNAPLIEVFNHLSEQSGYDFIITRELLKQARPVTIRVQNAEFESVLSRIFNGQPFQFQIEEKTVVISPKKQTILEQVKTALHIPIKVRGKVTDENGNPLPKASVIIKGTNNVSLTDEAGYFTLNGVAEEAVIIVTYIGYENLELKASPDMVFTLKPLLNRLTEVVVNKGYYTERKALSTGSVSSVKASEISRQPVSDPLLALQGKVPGLYLYQTTGVPGSGMVVRLRGQNSIANGNDPFYLVDGVPFNSNNLSQNTNAAGSNLSPFVSIRPEDIESIEVLKDADATAIYGSRGANGVILITTKKGKAGKTSTSFNISNGTGKVTRFLDLMNTAQYLEMRKEAFKNDGLDLPTTVGLFGTDADLLSYDQSKDTDWQQAFIGGTARYTNAQGSISSGNAQTQFLLSGSFRKETTVFPGDYDNQIGSGLANIRHTSENGRFQVDFNVNYASTNNRLPILDYTSYIFMAPNAPDAYKADGTLNWDGRFFDNPFAIAQQRLSAKTRNLTSNAALSYNLFKGLQLKTNLGYSRMTLQESTIVPATARGPLFANPPTDRLNIAASSEVDTWILDPQLNYQKQLKDHRLEVLAGGTWQQNVGQSLSQRLSGFSSDDLIENPGAASIISLVQAGYSKYRYNAVYARIGYNYQEKYILNLTGRRDGSSRFGPERQFGNFGAIGAAWILSKEAFLKLPAFVSFAKLRGSIGRTGNDKISDYQYLSSYLSSGFSYLGISTLNPRSLTNPLYGWETINKLEATLETGFLKDRLLFNVSWYRNRSGNQLVGYNLPALTGFSTVQANLPAVVENSGWEFDVASTNLNSGQFTWTTRANLSIPTNKLVSYPGIERSPYAYRYVIGQPLFVQFVYEYQGIDPATGLYQFNDRNQDGNIGSDADRIPVFVGQKWFGGVNNSITYKGLSLDFSFQFVKQTGYDKIAGIPGWYNYNQPTTLLNRWQKPGDQPAYQRYTTGYDDAYTANDNFIRSNGLVTDASFIRLKNAQLSWQLPVIWQKKVGMSNARLYLQGQNLFTITRYKGLDPENTAVSDGVVLPSLRVIVAGLQFSL